MSADRHQLLIERAWARYLAGESFVEAFRQERDRRR